jgi:hypothetical protein
MHFYSSIKVGDIANLCIEGIFLPFVFSFSENTFEKCGTELPNTH